MRMLFFVVLAICLVSCDPGVTYYQRLENKSSFKLMLTWPSDSTQIDTAILLSQGEVTIFELSKIGHASEFDDCTFRIDSINIMTVDTNLSFIGNLKYNFSLLQDKTMYSEGECRTIVTNSMFQ